MVDDEVSIIKNSKMTFKMLKCKFFWTAGIIFRIIYIADLIEVMSFVDFKYSLLESTCLFFLIVLCVYLPSLLL